MGKTNKQTNKQTNKTNKQTNILFLCEILLKGLDDKVIPAFYKSCHHLSVIYLHYYLFIYLFIYFQTLIVLVYYISKVCKYTCEGN